MRRPAIRLGLSALLLSGLSCASTPNQCKANPPSWVEGGSDPGPFAAVGVAEEAPGGLGTTRGLATADGRQQLVAKLQVQVRTMIKSVTRLERRNEVKDDVSQQKFVFDQAAAEVLVGSRATKYWTDPCNGRVFALVVADGQVVDGAVKKLGLSTNDLEAVYREMKTEAKKAGAPASR